MKMIKNKLGAMRPSSYLLMALAVSLVVVSAYMVIGEFKTNYPEVFVNETWESVYEQAESIKENVELSSETIINATAALQEAEGFFETAFAATVASLALITQAGKLVLNGMTGLISVITTAFIEAGVPGVIVGFIITAISIIVLFGVISAIRKYKEV